MTKEALESLINTLGAINTSLLAIDTRLKALEAKAHEHPMSDPPVVHPVVHPEIGTMDLPNYCARYELLR